MNSMIQTVDLTKKFNDFVANDHINLDVKEQEIKCIVGENGAGKSTMMNMLYGLLQPTSGKILIRGKEVTLNSPVDAIANGIGMVHQHFKLVPSLTAQKVIIARELSANPKLLIACQPTRGVDIGSIEFIHKQILKFRDAGNTVILISSELSEIMSLSDRVIVMYKGKISGEVSPKEVSMAAMGLLMAGIGKEEQDHEKER